jgi:YD repeat-containing protein
VVGGVSYRYDKNGNLTDINSAQYEYVYDCENRLIEAKENGSTVAAYKYDYAGRRVRKIVYGEPNVVTGYLYDGDQVIGEYDVNGTTYTLLRKFYYGPGIDEPICMERTIAGGGAGLFYYHYDGLGSVVVVSDAGAKIVEKVD